MTAPEEPIGHTVVHNTTGYSESSLFPRRRLMVLTSRIDCCDEHVLCHTVILRSTQGGTLRPWRTLRDLVLWEEEYPAAQVTVGGLTEAHAHVVARVRAGELP